MEQISCSTVENTLGVQQRFWWNQDRYIWLADLDHWSTRQPRRTSHTSDPRSNETRRLFRRKSTLRRVGHFRIRRVAATRAHNFLSTPKHFLPNFFDFFGFCCSIFCTDALSASISISTETFCPSRRTSRRRASESSSWGVEFCSKFLGRSFVLSAEKCFKNR